MVERVEPQATQEMSQSEQSSIYVLFGCVDVNFSLNSPCLRTRFPPSTHRAPSKASTESDPRLLLGRREGGRQEDGRLRRAEPGHDTGHQQCGGASGAKVRGGKGGGAGHMGEAVRVLQRCRVRDAASLVCGLSIYDMWVWVFVMVYPCCLCFIMLIVQ